jgi:hypothetical protein
MSERTGVRCGVVTVEDDGRQRPEFRRSWPDPIQDVGDAVTRPERLPRWIGTYDAAVEHGAPARSG